MRNIDKSDSLLLSCILRLQIMCCRQYEEESVRENKIKKENHFNDKWEGECALEIFKPSGKYKMTSLNCCQYAVFIINILIMGLPRWLFLADC